MKVLFLATTSFPFGYAEPLIFDKLKTWNEFDQIIVFQPLSIQQKPLYALPKNTHVIQLKNSLSTFEKLLGVKNIFSPILRAEVKLAKQRGISWSLSHWKVLLNTYSLALANKKILEETYASFPTEFTSIYFLSYWCTEATIAAALLKKDNKNIRLVSRMHAFDLYEERHVPNYLPLRGLLLQFLDKVVFISEQGKNYFTAKYDFIHLQNEEKLLVSRLGVFKEDLDTLSNIDLPTSKFTIVSCSSLIPLKRIELIIVSLALLKDTPIHWVHFGDGPLMQELLTLATSSLQETSITFEFKGFVLNHEIKEFFGTNRVDLFLNTSKYEGLPISMMEAIAYGIPCIGTDVGGVSEIIHVSTGYLLHVDFSPKELAELILQFTILPVEKRLEMQQNAYATWKDRFDGAKNSALLKSVILEEKKQCSICLFDTTMYPSISFDAQGVCNVCHANKKLQEKTLFTDDVKQRKLSTLLAEIKQRSSKKYDCLIGLSGGVDSSYVAYKAKEWGLNPLILHIDNGWNSELASMNIENIVKKLGFDLYTYVINWKEMKDLQLSFLKASVVDIDLPMDNAIMAINFKIANKFGIKHILSGVNTATEGWMPTDFSHYKLDALNIRSIQRKFGTVKLSTFPTVSPISFFWHTRILKIQFCAPLDYLDYNKIEAKSTLIRQFGWRDYGGKHYENVFTKFYQGVILPQKFHFDKRISHLSVLISSGQLTKTEAIEHLKEPAYKEAEYMDDKLFFCKKIGLSEEEFDALMEQTPISHLSYTSYVTIINRLIRLKKRFSFN